MKDRTINNALLALRRQIIGNQIAGQDHVDALLKARGVALPVKYHFRAAYRGQMAALVLAALRDGPQTIRELAAYVADRRPEIGPGDAYKRTGIVLARLKRCRTVARERWLWGLAQ